MKTSTFINSIQHPHLSPSETWRTLFKDVLKSSNPEEVAVAKEVQADVESSHCLFTPSQLPAHEEMLRLLRENEPDTITIVAIGPLTNLALAASTEPETFLRVKEVVVMGGAVDIPGNVKPPDLSRVYSPTVLALPVPPYGLIKQPDTPLRRMLNIRNQMTPGAEFNVFADSVAAARVFALTGGEPKVTMPVTPERAEGKDGYLGHYPEGLSRKLKLKLFPLGKRGCVQVFFPLLPSTVNGQPNSFMHACYFFGLTLHFRYNNASSPPSPPLQILHGAPD